MNNLTIIGTGGHSKIVTEIANKFYREFTIFTISYLQYMEDI